MGDGQDLRERHCRPRGVTSVDGMTADWARFIRRARDDFRQNRQGCRSINRVVYDIRSKPPGTIEWE